MEGDCVDCRVTVSKQSPSDELWCHQGNQKSLIGFQASGWKHNAIGACFHQGRWILAATCRGTSLIKYCNLLGPYTRTIPPNVDPRAVTTLSLSLARSLCIALSLPRSHTLVWSAATTRRREPSTCSSSIRQSTCRLSRTQIGEEQSTHMAF